MGTSGGAGATHCIGDCFEITLLKLGQTGFAEAVKAAVDMPVIAVGQISEPHQAENILLSGQADMVAMARPMLFNPRWAWHAAQELGEPMAYPRQYERGRPDKWGASGINAPGNLIPEK